MAYLCRPFACTCIQYTYIYACISGYEDSEELLGCNYETVIHVLYHLKHPFKTTFLTVKIIIKPGHELTFYIFYPFLYSWIQILGQFTYLNKNKVLIQILILQNH